MERQELVSKAIREPLCGWQWVYAHYHDLDNWHPTIELVRPGYKQTIHLKQIERIGEIIKANK